MARHAFKVCLFVLSLTAPTVSAQPIVIDGHFDPAEWASATTYGFDVTLPGGGTTPAKLFITNDRSNLYVALRVKEPAFYYSEAIDIWFDSPARDGVVGSGDDELVLSFNNGCIGNKSFFDSFLYTGGGCPAGAICASVDSAAGGTTDGNGAVDNDGTWTTFELWHPLASADVPHDMQVRKRDDLGFVVMYRYADPSATVTDTFFPGPFRGSGLATYVTHP